MTFANISLPNLYSTKTIMRMVNRKKFTDFVDKIVFQTLADQKHELAVYNLERDDAVTALELNKQTDDGRLNSASSFSESVKDWLECLSILASTFHIWEYILRRRKEIEERKKEEKAFLISSIVDEWERTLVANGVKPENAAKIAHEFGSDLIYYATDI